MLCPPLPCLHASMLHPFEIAQHVRIKARPSPFNRRFQTLKFASTPYPVLPTKLTWHNMLQLLNAILNLQCWGRSLEKSEQALDDMEVRFSPAVTFSPSCEAWVTIRTYHPATNMHAYSRHNAVHILWSASTSFKRGAYFHIFCITCNF